MRFPDGFIEELRAAANAVAVVGSYLPLKKLGRSHKGLCPFHHEKTPSFHVDEVKGFFHCFGCGEGGDVFKFVMLFEKVGFGEAVKRVAELSGVPLPEETRGQRASDDRRERLYQLNEQALKVFRKVLLGGGGSAGRDYLARRGVEQEAIERFELGMAPEGWEGLSRALQQAGFSAAELSASGLAREREGGRGLYDRFHQRLIFPIRNASGRLVGFGGRSLGGQEPKYLNSPETEVYSKGEILYGLYQAKEAARRSECLVLVEGYLDLVSLHQAGVCESVASCGTALTTAQARLIARFARQALVAYDGDDAGQAAAKKALRVLLPERLQVKVVALEAGQDPDDFVRASGGEAFRKRMAEARDFLAFLADNAGLGAGAERTPEGRLALVNETLPVLALVSDPVERAVLGSRLAEIARIEEGVLREAIARAAADRKESIAEPAGGGSSRGGWKRAEVTLVQGLLQGLTAAPGAPEVEAADFAGLACEPVLLAIAEARAAGRDPRAAELLASLPGPAREGLGRALVDALEIQPEEFHQALSALRAERLRGELRRVQGAIPGAAGEEVDRLLERKLELTRMLDHLVNAGGQQHP